VNERKLSRLVRDLPEALEREKALLPALQRLGVSEDELRVLEGDEHLLRILAEEAQTATSPEARAELERVVRWHAARLARVAGDAAKRGTG
jgi:phytoene/squalene synthetase